MTNRPGGVIRYARIELDLDQAGFGAWLAGELGRAEPYPPQRVSEWENGRKSPRRNIRVACAPLAAKAALGKIKIMVAMGKPDADLTDVIVDSQS